MMQTVSVASTALRSSFRGRAKRDHTGSTGEEPDDAWEKTSEGKAALAEAEKLRKWQAEYDELRRAKEQGTKPQSKQSTIT